MVPYKVTLIPGDGVGPELVDAARRAVEATGVQIEWDLQPAGEEPARDEGRPLPDRVLRSIRANRVALKGPLSSRIDGPWGSPNVDLRLALDLYAGVRPCRSFPGVPSRYADVDLVVVRENTEDSYTGIEFEHGAPATEEMIGFVEATTGHRIREDSGLSIKAISAGASDRIARFAFGYAAEHGRRAVTAGHKANILKWSDGLFLEAVRAVAAEHPTIEFGERIIDNLAMQLVRRPQDHDVLVLPNLYGDIVSDLCAGLIGGPGLAPGVNLGDELAVFETQQGSAPHYRGLDRANPMAMMLCGAMMLRHLGEREAGDRLEAAVATVIADGRSVTADLTTREEAATTTQVRDAVISELISR